MQIITTEFPFVWLRYARLPHTDPARLLAELDALLARRERFVLLTDDAPSGDDRGADDHELRKQLAKWSKANRAQSREWIPAMIAIEPDTQRRAALDAFSGAFEKVWGYPLNAAATPVFYRVAADRLDPSPAIQVSGGQSSGEAEFVLVRDGGETFVGIASDHTDREVETYGITVSKQMCGKPCANTLWKFDDVAGHWDQLVLRAYATIGGERVLYQEGKVTAMRAPDDLLAQFARHDGRFVDGTAMLCGTLAAIGGIRPAERFEVELEDPVLGRTIRHAYAVDTLPVAG